MFRRAATMAFGRKEKNVKSRWSPKAIKALRRRYDETQAVFCQRLGVTPDALQFWEQNRGCPSGPAEMLLDRLLEEVESGDVRPHPSMNGHRREQAVVS